MKPVDDRIFRDALSRFGSGVTVVTTVVDGVDHAMTASAFTSVSLRPPQVLVVAHKVARFYEAVEASGVWGVSILSEQDRDASAWFAHRGRALDGQMDRFAHFRGEFGVPLLSTSLAWLECRTTDIHQGGDHGIIVGEVINAKVGDGDDPLLYYRSHYGTIIRSQESEKTVYRGEAE